MTQRRIVIVGGGFSGCAASITAAKTGAEVMLFERADMLSGAGLRACAFNSNGNVVATAEAKAMGAPEIFQALESIVLHKGNMVEMENTLVYNAAKVDSVIHQAVKKAGVSIYLETRVVDVEKKDGTIKAAILDRGDRIEGDSFVDCTGSFGGVDICTKYGWGCVMCAHYRCPIFGDRVSIATKAGAPELMRYRPDGTPGAVGSAMSLYKESLAPELKTRLEKEGALTIPLSPELIDYSKQFKIGAVRTRRQMENINLVDIGLSAKCVGIGYMSLSDLRKVPGFEQAVIDNPLRAGKGNSISKVSMAPREPSLLVKGFKNLFVAGEKGGPGTGIEAAICTGIIAGYNAARRLAMRELLILPRTTVIGDFIAFTGEMMETVEGLKQGYSFASGIYFQRMKELGLYNMDAAHISKRMEDSGLRNILADKLF